MTNEDLPGLMRTMRGLWPSYGGWATWTADVWAYWLEELRPIEAVYVAAAVRQLANATGSDFPPPLMRVAKMARSKQREAVSARYQTLKMHQSVLRAHRFGLGWPTNGSDPPAPARVARAQVWLGEHQTDAEAEAYEADMARLADALSGPRQAAKEAASHAERGRR